MPPRTRTRPAPQPPPSLLNVWQRVQRLLRRHLFPHLREYDFYAAPNPQTSWSKRPQHVTLSSTLWTDLLMLGILFRLNEFALAHLTKGVIGAWLPIAVFFSVFDMWETRVIFDSLFRFQDDAVHHLLGVIAWFLLAISATTITPLAEWSDFESLLFACVKVAHAAVRIFHYAETALASKSRRARRAALPRLVIFVSSFPFYLAAPVALYTKQLDLERTASLWIAGFLLQRMIWVAGNRSRTIRVELRQVKCNIPFVEQRMNDWIMLQLGAVVLGFVTVPVRGLDPYGVLVFAYVYVANMMLLTYSSIPEKPEDHALYRGGIREFIWSDLFNVGGLSTIGITVGLRVHLFYPQDVLLPANRHYSWILAVCASTNAVVMLLQDFCHGGLVARWNGGKAWFFKLFVAGAYLLNCGVFVASETHTVAFMTMGMAIISTVFLVTQIANGAFRKHIAHHRKSVLTGHFLAAVFGMVLLTRARRKLAAKRAAADGGGDGDSAEVKTTLSSVGLHSTSLATTTTTTTTTDTSSLADALPSGPRKRRRSSVTRAQRIISIARNDVKQMSVFINSRFYERPKPYIEGHKLLHYKLQWADLFFDVLYVAMVFRLGDLLLSGIGAGYAETSVHYLLDIGSNNATHFAPNNDPARSDGIWIFGSVFVATWSMWQTKLAYSSKIGNADVFHKLVEMFQGFVVLICAVNITSPRLLEDPSTGNAYGIAASLLAFQLSMIALWAEVYVQCGKSDPRVAASARRNLSRDGISVVPLIVSFATVAARAPLWITTTLWGLYWFLPFLLRVVFYNYINSKNSVRDLHRYVIHRLADASLIVLGEGVLQIVRTETRPTAIHYVGVTVGFFAMTAIRVAVFEMDCFDQADKHAQFLAIDAGIAAFFVRSVAAPALVACGVGLKKIVSLSGVGFSSYVAPYYWLLSGSSIVSLATLVVTYQLHRFARRRRWATKRLGFGLLEACLFLFFPWLPVPGWLLMLLVLSVWCLAIVAHTVTDDYFQKVKKRAMSLSHIHGLKREASAGPGGGLFAGFGGVLESLWGKSSPKHGRVVDDDALAANPHAALEAGLHDAKLSHGNIPRSVATDDASSDAPPAVRPRKVSDIVVGLRLGRRSGGGEPVPKTSSSSFDNVSSKNPKFEEAGAETLAVDEKKKGMDSEEDDDEDESDDDERQQGKEEEGDDDDDDDERRRREAVEF